MEAMWSSRLLLFFLFTCKLSPEVAAEVQESSGKRKKHLSDPEGKRVVSSREGNMVVQWVVFLQTRETFQEMLGKTLAGVEEGSLTLSFRNRLLREGLTPQVRKIKPWNDNCIHKSLRP